MLMTLRAGALIACLVALLTPRAALSQHNDAPPPATTSPLVALDPRRPLSPPAPSPLSSPMSLRLSYLGEGGVRRPGFAVALEYTLSQAFIFRLRRSPLLPKRRLTQRALEASVSTYIHPENHLGSLALISYVARRINRRGALFELIPRLGYMHVTRLGPIYVVGEDGALTERRFTMSPKFAAGFGLGFGRDLTYRPITPRPGWSWHVRPALLFEAPFNTTFLPHLIIEIGLNRRLKGSSP